MLKLDSEFIDMLLKNIYKDGNKSFNTLSEGIEDLISSLNELKEFTNKVENIINSNFGTCDKETKDDLRLLYPIMRNIKLEFGDDNFNDIINMLALHADLLPVYAKCILWSNQKTDPHYEKICYKSIKKPFTLSLSFGPLEGVYIFRYTGLNKNKENLISKIDNDLTVIEGKFEFILIASEMDKRVDIVKAPSSTMNDYYKFIDKIIYSAPTILKNSDLKNNIKSWDCNLNDSNLLLITV